ncbi:invasion associated locus B family protein [Aestuariicoccus sp. MJ-SS9]|uniref:invasion associated locus B family protein n=1 Tax=Aestuariicoccus sp. MJ-SS9 TaxID=3079855 RepID=UPI0029105180|nr:invasion associated locus B family protein [Aestuariicoccus sp. MJ-SS9]MDU8913047.1 invasion associated locus B family protein [Aestuariicoccus sp. MJ-SS9]
MTKTLFVLPLLAALAAPAAFAQQAAEGTGDATETQNQAVTGNQLDPGEPVGPEGEPEQPTYVKATYGDWDLQCLRVQEGEEPCQMYQLLKDPNGASVAEASLFKVANGGQIVAGGTFVVPLETLLTQKLTMAVDGGAARRYDFSFCTQIGCYARVGFTAEDVARFRAGANATVTIVPMLAPDQKVTVNMSLSGFTAAYNEVSELRQ